MGLFDAVGGVINSMFNYGATTATNAVNRKIADENLGFQKECAAIEDARYADETAYNRAFAEDQRDYERQLQQQIFEREDTAIERQANQLSKMGINPLSQGSLNGLGSGSVVSAAAAPASSSRSAEVPQNNFQAQAPKFDLSFGGMLDEINAIDNLNTRGVQRDLLQQQKNAQALENQSKAIENLIKMDKYDISVDKDGSLILNKKFTNKEQDKEALEYRDKSASTSRNERENAFQIEYGTHDNSSTRSNDLADLSNQVVRGTTASAKIASNANKASAEASNILLQSAKKKMSSVKSQAKSKWNDFKDWWKRHSYSGDEMSSIYGSSQGF